MKTKIKIISFAFFTAVMMMAPGGIAVASDQERISAHENIRDFSQLNKRYYLTDDNGAEMNVTNVVPGVVYLVRDTNAQGAVVGHAEWDGKNLSTQRLYERPNSSPGDALLAFARGLLHGSENLWDSVVHGIPAMVIGSDENVRELEKARRAAHKRWQRQTPLAEELEAARPMFGDDGSMSLARIFNTAGVAVPYLALSILFVSIAVSIARKIRS